MDKHPFDGFARALTTQQPRRAALRLLGVAAIPALAMRLPAESALARKKRKHKKKKHTDKKPNCASDQIVCRGECVGPGLVCCPGSTDGLDASGLCPTSVPSCCPLSLFGGCCPPERPVCCLEDCCPAGDTCDEDGYCSSDW